MSSRGRGRTCSSLNRIKERKVSDTSGWLCESVHQYTTQPLYLIVGMADIILIYKLSTPVHSHLITFRLYVEEAY